MECSCIDAYHDDGDCVSLLRDEMPVARKQHKCYECYGAIRTGERYRLETFVQDGKFDRQKTCLVCNSVRTEMFCSCAYGEIWQTLNDEIIATDGSMAWPLVAALIPAAREKVCDLIEAYWED